MTSQAEAREEDEADHLPDPVASLGLRPCLDFALEFLQSFSDDPTKLQLVSVRSGRGAFEALLNDFCGVWPVGIQEPGGSEEPFLDPKFATVEDFIKTPPRDPSCPLLLLFQEFGPSDTDWLRILKPAGFLTLSGLDRPVQVGDEYRVVRELANDSWRMQWWAADFQCTHCRNTRPMVSRFWCAVCLQAVCTKCAYGNRCLTCEAKMQRLAVLF
jgi:hypothetical protein